MCKIIARQVPPEQQESPLYWEDFSELWPGIILDGNNHYQSHTTELYDRIISAYDDAAQEIEDQDTRSGYAAYSNATETITDYFPPLEYREKPYSTREIHAIREALRMYGSSDYYNGRYITAMLDAITGGDWRNGTLSGCCQGDWQNVIYDANRWSRDDLETLETEYFNMGTEYITDDDNVSIYCYGWSDNQHRAEIAAALGCDPADVTLLKFTGWSHTAQYEEV